MFGSNDEALIDELGRAGEEPICSKSFTSKIRAEDFSDIFAEAADFSDIPLNIVFLPHKFPCARIAVAAT
ncbi:MAG: hypothetical protein J2P21_22710 [Chloracidobacterium sp.]|nr:hypothetical protein [Chloracidobacterium sp.]